PATMMCRPTSREDWVRLVSPEIAKGRIAANGSENAESFAESKPGRSERGKRASSTRPCSSPVHVAVRSPATGCSVGCRWPARGLPFLDPTRFEPVFAVRHALAVPRGTSAALTQRPYTGDSNSQDGSESPPPSGVTNHDANPFSSPEGVHIRHYCLQQR